MGIVDEYRGFVATDYCNNRCDVYRRLGHLDVYALAQNRLAPRRQ